MLGALSGAVKAKINTYVYEFITLTKGNITLRVFTDVKVLRDLYW